MNGETSSHQILNKRRSRKRHTQAYKAEQGGPVSMEHIHFKFSITFLISIDRNPKTHSYGPSHWRQSIINFQFIECIKKR